MHTLRTFVPTSVPTEGSIVGFAAAAAVSAALLKTSIRSERSRRPTYKRSCFSPFRQSGSGKETAAALVLVAAAAAAAVKKKSRSCSLLLLLLRPLRDHHVAL